MKKPAINRLRLLIVDDHEMVREGLRSIFEDEAEFKVVGEAGDGEKALELVDKLHPDIVLLDLKMPGMDGIEVCRRITAGFADIVVVALTTFADEKLARECLQAGARGYVLKDVERFQLKQILRTIVSGGSVVDPNVVGRMVDQTQGGPTEQKGSRNRDELTAQQIAILRLVAQGFSNKEIGVKMDLSENTVKSYIQDLLEKMGVRNRVEAAMVASTKGWI